MNEIVESLAHTTYECKYHVVFIPKCRRKVMYREIRRHLGEVFHELARRRESKVEEGHLMVDHVHMLLSIPPKWPVSGVVGYIKGKSAIHIARTFQGRRLNYVGQHFWARGFWVSTIGRMNRRFGNTSGTRKRRTSAWISWNCSERERRC